ncbi:hypothetical protein HDU82_000883 [Entophlyctis luteolus]|nr:hypothetical protein HDU82_000883 [Entophlyctis luteolus]
MGLVQEGELARLVFPSDLSHTNSSCIAIELNSEPVDQQTILDWIGSEILGTACKLSLSDLNDPFILIQTLAIVSPESVNLSFFSSDHAFSCEDLNAVTVEMLFNSLSSMNLSDDRISKEDLLQGNSQAMFKIASRLYSFVKQSPKLSLKALEIYEPEVKIPSQRKARSQIEAETGLYEPSEASFLPIVRWLFRLIVDESDTGLSYSCMEEIIRLSQVLESATKSFPERDIIPVLTHGALYTAVSRFLFEDCDTNGWIDSLIAPNQRLAEQTNDWISEKNGFLEILAKNNLLNFQNSLRSCIGDMLKDDCPFYEVEAFMQHSIRNVLVENIVDHIRQQFPNMAIQMQPYDIEEALIFWIRVCVQHCAVMWEDEAISDWKRRKEMASELTDILRDGAAACTIAFVYINCFKFSEISFCDDATANWTLLESAAESAGFPFPHWKPSEISEGFNRSDFEVSFLVYACEMFQWIDLTSKVPVDEITVTTASPEEKTYDPDISQPPADAMTTFVSSSKPENPTIFEEPSTKWLPIDDEIFKISRPESNNCDGPNLTVSIEQEKFCSVTVSIKSRPITPVPLSSEILECRAPQLHDQLEIVPQELGNELTVKSKIFPPESQSDILSLDKQNADESDEISQIIDASTRVIIDSSIREAHGNTNLRISAGIKFQKSEVENYCAKSEVCKTNADLPKKEIIKPKNIKKLSSDRPRGVKNSAPESLIPHDAHAIISTSTAKDRKIKLRNLLATTPVVENELSITIPCKNSAQAVETASFFPNLACNTLSVQVRSSSPSAVPKLPPIQQQIQIFVQEGPELHNASEFRENSSHIVSEDHDSSDEELPSFNVSDIVMSDLEENSDSDILQLDAATETMKLRLTTKRRHLQKQKQLHCRSDDEWTEISTGRSSFQLTPSCTKNRRLRSSKRLIRVPIRDIQKKIDKQHRIAEESQGSRSREATSSPHLASLPKFKGLVFVPLQDRNGNGTVCDLDDSDDSNCSDKCTNGFVGKD